jgi:hypothetical protein
MSKHWTYEKSFDYWTRLMYEASPKLDAYADGVDWLIENWVRMVEIDRRVANDSRMHPQLRGYCRDDVRALIKHLSGRCGEHLLKYNLSLPRYGCNYCVTQEHYMGVSTAETLGVGDFAVPIPHQDGASV